MPDGKPAGVRCVNLSDDNECTIHDQPDYPEVCRKLTPDAEMCGATFAEAMIYLTELEILTTPDTKPIP